MGTGISITTILKYGKIKPLLPDPHRGGYSGEVSLLEYHGKNYILRSCRRTEIVSKYLIMYRHLEEYGFLPKLLGVAGNKLLFEYIEGRDCIKKDAPKVAFSVGSIAARVNNLSFPTAETFDIDKRFIRKLTVLGRRAAIHKEIFIEAKRQYFDFRKRVRPKFGIELTDLVYPNFRLWKRRLYLVDFDAINYDLIGRGIARSFIKWFTTNEQRVQFLKGYNTVSSTSFFTTAYRRFSFLYELVSDFYNKFEKSRDYSLTSERLTLFLHRQLR